MDGMRGWTLRELEHARCPEEKPTGLPRMKKGCGIYTMPMNYPWDLPARKCEVYQRAGAVETIEPIPVETTSLLTGQIGMLQGITMHCDAYQPAPKYQTKYIYSIVHKRGKVMVYVWERNPDPASKKHATYWYEYRAAREARVDMKRYGIGRRGW